jgi:hypothetical protein
VKGICKNAKDGGKIRGGLPSAWVIESEAVAVAANQVCTS